jgi:hypothetical protein
MFEIMDGLEYNGLMYSLVQAENGEPVWSNIYIRNFEIRDNESYVDRTLLLLIGKMVTVFACFTDLFQIRDKA